MPDALRSLADGDAAVAEAIARYTHDYLAEVTEEQTRRADIVAEALQRSSDDNLSTL